MGQASGCWGFDADSYMGIRQIRPLYPIRDLPVQLTERMSWAQVKYDQLESSSVFEEGNKIGCPWTFLT